MTPSNEATTAETFCVFQIGETLFAIEAATLREVALRPELAEVPNSGPVLAGLWHEGSEFLPVLRLPEYCQVDNVEPHMLVVKGAQCAWCLLVDHVLGIETVGKPNTESREEGAWADAQIGTANWRSQSVRVLSPDGVYRLAEQRLQDIATSA